MSRKIEHDIRMTLKSRVRFFSSCFSEDDSGMEWNVEDVFLANSFERKTVREYMKEDIIREKNESAMRVLEIDCSTVCMSGGALASQYSFRDWRRLLDLQLFARLREPGKKIKL